MRRFAFWFFLTLSVLLAAVYAASLRYALLMQIQAVDYQFEIMGGVCVLQRVGRPAPHFITIQSHNWGHRWVSFDGNFGGKIYLRVPLYAPLAGAAAATVVAGLWPRKRRPFACLRCDYDLRGQLMEQGTVRCPECGTRQPPYTSAQQSRRLG